MPGEIWVDEDGRLLRFRVPEQQLEVAREDVVSVSSRVERLGRAGDERVFIPSNGFSLVGTVSVPVTAPSAAGGAKAPVTRLAAVVLVPGSGLADRDESIAGVPIFAQIANAAG